MKFSEDPRIRVGRRCLALAWVYYSIYLIALMLFSYIFGTTPRILGLPGWVAIGNIAVPVTFVIALIIVAEKLIPDIPLSENDETSEKIE